MSEGYPYCRFYCAFAKIYTLSDLSGNVFYVGCTIQPVEIRLKMHIAEAKNQKIKPSAKNLMIRNLNYEVIITIVDIRYVTGNVRKYLNKSVFQLEKDWIEKYIGLGYELTNHRKKPGPLKIKTTEAIGQSYSLKNGIARLTTPAEPVNVGNDQRLK